MRKSTGTALKQVEPRADVRPLTGSLGSPANVFLTLPSVSEKVLVKATSTVTAERWAEIALQVLELVDEKKIKAGKNLDPREVVQQALSIWASKHCSEIKVLGGFGISAALSGDDLSVQGHDELNGENWLIGLSSAQTEIYFTLKPKVEALEALFPGLGHTAVHFAEMASYRTVTMFTANVAFSYAQSLYWYGQETDDDYISEANGCGEEIGEDEGSEEHSFKPSDFLKSFPDFFFSGEKLSSELLKSIAESEDSEAGEVARIILSINRSFDDEARLPDLQDCEVDQVYFSGYMGWDDSDSLSRCADDFVQSANECSDSYTDLFGVTKVPFNKKAFQKWRAGMEKGFELYTQLDRLMQLIGTTNH